MNQTPLPSPLPQPPHHKLIAYGVARELVLAVGAAAIRSPHLRDQALRAAQSAALNCAEGAGRVSRADKARAFAIARAEAVEACAAVEIAQACGEVSAAREERILRLADRLVAFLTGLLR